MLGESRFLHSLRLRNFLSFGPESEAVELKSLNVLIGPNASGKSNFIEAIGLLKASSREGREGLAARISDGGGVSEWLWKGGEGATDAELEATIDYAHEYGPLRHSLTFGQVDQRLQVVHEVLGHERPVPNRTIAAPFFYYNFQAGLPLIYMHNTPSDEGDNGDNNYVEHTPSDAPPQRGRVRRVRPEHLLLDQSIVSQRRDPEIYPEITYLGQSYSNIRSYRDWRLGPEAPPRKWQPNDLPGDFLEEDARNLAHVLLTLDGTAAGTEIISRLQELHGAFYYYTIESRAGDDMLYLLERGMKNMPATRLSDGTLKYLCLLAILLHPNPPPLICIEEPELGLHPDLLHILAKLLIEASHRTQLIVTTHSDILVDALSEVPEAVVVCEREKGSTVMRRLDAKSLKVWLKKYSLGELWLSGQLGGNRW